MTNEYFIKILAVCGVDLRSPEKALATLMGYFVKLIDENTALKEEIDRLKKIQP